MSVSSLDKDILKSLENAFDVGKIVSAFDSLIHVINEQGSKLVEQQLRMDEQEEKFSRQQAELLDQINYLSQRTMPSDENRILLDLNQDESADPAATALDPATTGLDPATTALDPATTGLDPATTALDPATTGLDPATTALDPAVISDEPEKLSGEAPVDILVTDQPKQNEPRKRSEPLVEPIKAFSVYSATSSRKNSSRLNYDISSISELTPIIADQIAKQLALQQALVEAKFQELDKRVHDALQELNGVSGMDSSVLTRDLTQDFDKGLDWFPSKAIPRKPSSARIINQMNNRTLSAREVAQHIKSGDVSVEEVTAQMSAGSEPAKEALEQLKADEVVREIVEQMNKGAIAVPEVIEHIHTGVVPVAAVIAQMNAGSVPAKLVMDKLKADDEFVKIVIDQMNTRKLSVPNIIEHILAGIVPIADVMAQMNAGSIPAKEVMETLKTEKFVKDVIDRMNSGELSVPTVVEQILAGIVPIADVMAQMNAGSIPAKEVMETLKTEKFVKDVLDRMNSGELSVPTVVEQILAGIVPVAKVMAQMNAGSIPAKELFEKLKTEKFVKIVLDRMNAGELSIPTVVEQILAGIVPVADVMAQMNAGSIPAKEVMEKLKTDEFVKDVIDRMNAGELSVPEVVEQILVNIVPVAEVVAQMNAGSIPAKEVMERMKTDKHIQLVLDRLDAGELSVSVLVDHINANIVPVEQVIEKMNAGSIPAMEAIKEWSKERFVEEMLKQMNAGAIPAQVVVDQIIVGDIPVEQVVQQMNAGSNHAKEVIELLNAQSSSLSPASAIAINGSSGTIDGGELTTGLANKIFWNAPTGTGTANKGVKPLKVSSAVAAADSGHVSIPRDVLNKINEGNKRISALEDKLTTVTAQLEAIRLDNVKLKLENIEKGIMVKKKMKLEKMRRELVDSEAEDKDKEKDIELLGEGKAPGGKAAVINTTVPGLKSTQSTSSSSSSSKTMYSPKSLPIDQMRAQIMAMANSPKQISYSANDDDDGLPQSSSTTTTNAGRRPQHSAGIEDRNALSADAGSSSSTAPPPRAYPSNSNTTAAQPTDAVTAASASSVAKPGNHMTADPFPTESRDHSNTSSSMADSSQVLHGQGHLPQQSIGSSTLDSDIADVINEIAPMLDLPLTSELLHPSISRQAATPSKDEEMMISYERLQALQEYKKLKVGRRKMNVLNLSMSDGKRQRLVKKLRRRGMLMKLSRSMLEDSKRKYANASLKQRVEYLDIQTTNLQALISKAKEQIKDQYKQIRTLLPIDFYETYDRVASFLDDFDAVGGIDEIAAIPSADRLIAYEENGSLPNPFVNAIKKAVLTDTERLVYELEKKVKAIKNESVEKNDIASMLNMRSSLLSADSASVQFDSKQDANQNKLIALIFKCIDHSKLIDSQTQGKIVQPSHLDNSKGRAYRDINGGRAVDSGDRNDDDDSDLLVAPGVGKEYVDFKCKEIMDELITLQKRFNTKTEVSDSLLSRMKAQVGHIEKQSQKILENEEEVREQRKKDNEAVRILQKRFASASIEKIVDELKTVQTMVNDRPSTSDVGNMLDSISHTFKKHLGENVLGLKTLVDEVYKQIHQKVNREDIKKLISAKLHQMEQEILQKEEEMFSQAVTTRCLSCGQLPPDASKVFSQSNMGGRKPPMDTNAKDTAADGSIEGATNNDDAAQEDSLSVQQKVRSEEVYTLLTGSAGLKPLLQQQKPMSPKDPYGYSAQRMNTMPQNKLKNSGQGKIPEQRYRKAQMAAHLKEMIKVTPAASQNYGFNAHNPFYAGDSLTLDLEERSQGMDPLHSRHPILKANHSSSSSRGRPSTTQASGYASLEGPIYIAVPSSLQSKSQQSLSHKHTDNTVQLPAITQS